MENSGKASREVVQTLINDMHDFSNYVNSEIQSMQEQTTRLGETWKDPQYTQFESFIRELADALNKDLAVFDDATASLERKLSMY